jgi:hypothetical protein
LTRSRQRCNVRRKVGPPRSNQALGFHTVKRLIVVSPRGGARLLVDSRARPRQSCPNQNFGLIPVDTSFLASKDHNENGLVCRSRDFEMPPPGYPTPFIVIDDLA